MLQVISSSPGELEPVFDTMLANAVRMCGAKFGTLYLCDGDGFRAAAIHNAPPSFARERSGRLHPGPHTSLGRAVRTKQAAQIEDITAGPAYLQGESFAVNAVELAGYRAVYSVPLLKDNELIGAISIYHQEVHQFSPKEIALVENFASQAVIAIENTRLFNEIVKKSRELEIASQHKSQFVANMSHELRTPLAAILGYAELMQEGFYEPQGKKSLDALTRIRSNGKHLLGLINTVLDIAKIESRPVQPQPRRIFHRERGRDRARGHRVPGRNKEAWPQDRRGQVNAVRPW